MSDNNSKSLIEDTVKLLKLESKELNEISVPGLPMSYSSARTNQGRRGEMEALARKQAMGRWSSSLGRKQEQKNTAGQGQATTHPHRAHEAGKGGLLHPRNWTSTDNYDQAGGYEKNETNESFSQYYGKATHHPMTKHGDPVQDSWNDQLRSRSGMMTQNNLKSYTEPYWNTTKTGPSTEREFIDMHKVNGILDGEDYIKSTFDNINNSVPFKSHGRDNDASPTQDAKTILPQIHKNDENEDTSDTMKLNKMKIAYESVLKKKSESVIDLNEIFDDEQELKNYRHQGFSQLPSEEVNTWKKNHDNRIAYSTAKKDAINKSLDSHISDMNSIAKQHDKVIGGHRTENAINSLVDKAKRGKYQPKAPGWFSGGVLGNPQRSGAIEHKNIPHALKGHVENLVKHIQYNNNANAALNKSIDKNNDALDHLNTRARSNKFYHRYLTHHAVNAHIADTQAKMYDPEAAKHHENANKLRQYGRDLHSSTIKDVSYRTPSVTGEGAGSSEIPAHLSHVQTAERNPDGVSHQQAESDITNAHIKLGEKNPSHLVNTLHQQKQTMDQIAEKATNPEHKQAAKRASTVINTQISKAKDHVEDINAAESDSQRATATANLHNSFKAGMEAVHGYMREPGQGDHNDTSNAIKVTDNKHLQAMDKFTRKGSDGSYRGSRGLGGLMIRGAALGALALAAG